MPPLTTQLIQEPRYLGQVFGDLDRCYDEADYEQTFLEFIPELQHFEQSLFENEKAPNGEPWAPLAPATIKEKGHDVILHRTGALGQSLFGESPDSIHDAEDRF